MGDKSPAFSLSRPVTRLKKLLKHMIYFNKSILECLSL